MNLQAWTIKLAPLPTSLPGPNGSAKRKRSSGALPATCSHACYLRRIAIIDAEAATLKIFNEAVGLLSSDNYLEVWLADDETWASIDGGWNLSTWGSTSGWSDVLGSVWSTSTSNSSGGWGTGAWGGGWGSDAAEIHHPMQGRARFQRLNISPAKLDHPKRPSIEPATEVSTKFPFWEESVGVSKRKVIGKVPDV
ncbi:hypothetical protein C8R45DRAFT_922691 [Mycena sanguinolenta]|nr:hypothetical protein C8R45DRAFT_922691 [Mycena sanguinolenta]